MQSRETVVLLHDSADGASAWDRVAGELIDSGHEVFQPDLIGYGASKQPSCCYKIAKEVQHLQRRIDAQRIGSVHLVGHGYGAFAALHLRQALGPRVKRMTLVAPLVAGILRECCEIEAHAELDRLYKRFMSLSTHNETAAEFFIDHWRGQGAWAALPSGSQSRIASLIPKIRREMVALHADKSRLSLLAGAPIPVAVLLGENSCRPVRAASWRLAEGFHSDPIFLSGGGHMIPQTHAEEVAEVISRLAVVETARRRSIQPMPQAAFA